MSEITKNLCNTIGGKEIASAYSEYSDRASKDVNGNSLTLTISENKVTEIGGVTVGGGGGSITLHKINTGVICDQNNEAILDSNNEPITDSESIELIDKIDGTGILASRAINDEDGNDIKSTYATKTEVLNVIENTKGAIKNGGALTDAASIDVPNNSVFTLSTIQAALAFNVNVEAGDSPNFAVKITSNSQTDGTVSVYKKENGIYSALMPSVAGGTTVEAGKTYQLTCVGDCWTLAEFEEPEQGIFTVIGGRRYSVVKIGNQYWMTENLDWQFNGLAVGELTPSMSNPQANYYNNDESTYGTSGNKYGLLYNFPALERLAALLQDGWRVPTVADWNALITSVGGTSTAGTKLKSTTGWDYNQNGDGSYEFEAFPAGYLHVSGGSGIFGDIGSYAQFWTSDEFSETNANALMLTLGASSSPTVYDKNYGCSVRLVNGV